MLLRLSLAQTDLADMEIDHYLTLGGGLDALSEKDYALVLLDLSLPDSRGFETLERLLGRFPMANVIVMTGLGDDHLGLEAVRLGAQDFAVKGSLDPNQLAKMLRYTIERGRSRARMREMQSLAHIGNWELHLPTRQWSASEECFRILGLKREKAWLIWDEALPAYPVLQCINDTFETVLEQGACDLNTSFDLPDGTKRYIYIRCKSALDLFGEQVISGIIQDVTEEREGEELRKVHEVAQRSNRLKEQFVASISHEMRTPMNAILGMSNLLASTEMNGEQRSYVDSIRQSSEILLGVINDILEIASIQNGKIHFERQAFHLPELLDHMVQAMQYKTKEKDLVVEWVKPGQALHPWLWGDKLRLNQVLFNLVGNAVKFTDRGSVRVHLQIKASTDQRLKLRFNVVDTGIGIPADQLDAIFDTFTRVRTKDRIFEGTGLGLSIVKNLVELQGGSVGVDSVLGEGSTFWFEMEFELAESQETSGPVISSPSAPADRPLRILLAEDHKMNQLVARKTLERQYPNLHLDIADHGEMAVEFLQQYSYDLVLMDIQMPVMDGFETTRYIRANVAGPEQLPVLAMTAHANIEKDEQFHTSGFNGFVLKPFEQKQLFAMIDQFTPVKPS